MHHEHVDGSGYHRGNRAAAQPESARLLGAADAYIAMRASRAYRPALDPDRAGAELRKLAEDDRLDAVAVNAVLNAAGDHGPQVRRRWPAGLTDREVDVLRRVALGGSIQDAAIALYLAPKTVDFHLQNIYSKVGVSTRAAATLFAIQNGLLQP
jgi:DNA-binding NarL/FixJ family response regulator